MKLLVFGAGAIGTYIGGSLGLAGHKVTFLERQEVAAGLIDRGVVIHSPAGRRRLVEFDVTASLGEALTHNTYDLAILAIKSFDTETAAAQMQPFASQMPPLFCLQNGVENEAKLAQVLGKDKVIAGTVTTAIGRQPSGEITVERLRGIGITDGFPISQAIVNAMQAARLNPTLFTDAPSMKWSKMLTNLQANASAAILNMTPAEVYSHPGLFALERRQFLEALAVMQAEGLRVVDLPGTPVRALAFIMRLPFTGLSRALLKRAIGSGRGGKMPSFHIDLYSGRGNSEVDYLNGAVVRAGQRVSIAAPVNRFFNETLLKLTHKELALGTYDHQPEQLIQTLQSMESV